MAVLTIIDKEAVGKIHQLTLQLLEETGVQLTYPKGRELLISHGCEATGNRVKIPAELVDKCLLTAGKRTVLKGRGGTEKSLGDGLLYFHNLGGAPQVFEENSKTRRSAVIDDVRKAAILLDALENCHTITPFFTPTDISGEMMSVSMYRHTLSNTTKPVQGPGVQSCIEVKFITKMAEVIGKPEETLTLSVSPVSPLSFPDNCVEAIIEIASLGIPFAPLPCPTAGTTAPFSLSSAGMQQNAEVLAALTLSQLVRPGLPIIYCGRLAMMEPHSGLSVWGGVETGMASAMTVQLGHFYSLPVNVYGFSTNSHEMDAQNGFERAMNVVLPALAGADELSGIGEMEAGVMGSYAQMVLDNEFAGSVQRIRKGIEFEADAVDVISSVVLSSRNFLTHRQTTKKLREGEIFITELAERGSWEHWIESGRQGMVERASASAERIIREHKIQPLSATQEGELNELMKAADKELSKKRGDSL